MGTFFEVKRWYGAALCSTLLVVGLAGCGGSKSSTAEDQVSVVTSAASSVVPRRAMPKASPAECTTMIGNAGVVDDSGSVSSLLTLLDSGSLDFTRLTSLDSMLRNSSGITESALPNLPEAVRPSAESFINAITPILLAIGPIEPNGPSEASRTAIRAAIAEQSPKIAEAVAEVKEFTSTC